MTCVWNNWEDEILSVSFLNAPLPEPMETYLWDASRYLLIFSYFNKKMYYGHMSLHKWSHCPSPSFLRDEHLVCWSLLHLQHLAFLLHIFSVCGSLWGTGVTLAEGLSHVCPEDPASLEQKEGSLSVQHRLSWPTLAFCGNRRMCSHSVYHASGPLKVASFWRNHNE